MRALTRTVAVLGSTLTLAVLAGCSPATTPEPSASTSATPTTAPAPAPAPAPTITVVPSAPAAAPAVDETAAIVQSGRERSEAMVDGDIDRLSALLSDDFIAVHITGYEQPKQEWLQQISAGEMVYHDVEEVLASVEFSSTDAATLTARNLVSATINGSNGTWPLESTTTYAKRDGVWLATRSRSTTY